MLTCPNCGRTTKPNGPFTGICDCRLSSDKRLDNRPYTTVLHLIQRTGGYACDNRTY